MVYQLLDELAVFEVLRWQVDEVLETSFEEFGRLLIFLEGERDSLLRRWPWQND